MTLNQWVPGSSPGGRTENPATSHESWIFFFVDSLDSSHLLSCKLIMLKLDPVEDRQDIDFYTGT